MNPKPEHSQLTKYLRTFNRLQLIGGIINDNIAKYGNVPDDDYTPTANIK